MEQIEQIEQQSKQELCVNISVCQKIKIVEGILGPKWKFDLEGLFGDGPRSRIPNIDENLHSLYFKYIGGNYSLYGNKACEMSKNDECEVVKKVNELGFGHTDIWTIQKIGKYLVVELQYKNNSILNTYSNYVEFKNKNIEKITEVFQYLEEKVPIDFVGYYLFNKSD